MAMQEALAFGLPVMALDTGNISNHKLEKHTLLFKDMVGLVEKLTDFCVLPQKWQAFSQQGERNDVLLEYDWQKAAQDLIKQLVLKKQINLNVSQT